MPSNTTNLNLLLYDSTADAGVYFSSYRQGVAGTVSSNMTKLDDFAGTVNAEIEALKDTPSITSVPTMLVDGVYTATISSITSYNIGSFIALSVDTENTGSVAINISNLGLTVAMKVDSTGSYVNLTAGDLKIKKEYLFKYDGVRWIWVSANSAEQISISGTVGQLVNISGNNTLASAGVGFDKDILADHIPVRDSSGNLQSNLPTGDDDVVTLTYAESNFGSYDDVQTILNGENLASGDGISLSNNNAVTTISTTTATSSALGTVKVGSTLDIVSGVLNYNLPTATSSVLGGVKVGDGLTIDSSGVLSSSSGGTGYKYSTIVIGSAVMGYTADDVDYLCTGISDQTIINTAIASLTATGGEVKILEGTYNITGSINVAKDNVNIVMTNGTIMWSTLTDSSTTIANISTRNKIFNVTGTGVSFSGGRIGSAYSSSVGISCTGGSINYIQNVEFVGVACGVAGFSSATIGNIEVFGTVKGAGTGTCGVYGNATDFQDIESWIDVSSSNSSTVYGVYLVSSTANNIMGNSDIINSSSVYGVYLSSSTANDVIVNGDVSNSGSSGYIYGVSVYSSSTVNDITVNGDVSGSSNVYEVNLSSSTANDITVNGDVSSSSSNGFGASLTSSTANDVIVNGDVSGSGLTYGVYFTSSSTVNDITVNGDVSGSSSNGGVYGVFFSSTSTTKANDVIVNGDVSSSGSSGSVYGVYSYSNTINDITINGSLSNAGGSVSGVYLFVTNTVNNITVNGDMSSGGSTSSAIINGVYLSSTSTASDVVVNGDVSTGNTAYGVYSEGTAKTIKVQATITSTSTTVYINGIRTLGTTTRNITIQDCVITVVGTSSYKSAINLGGSNLNCICANNILNTAVTNTATGNIDVRDNLIVT